MNTYPATREALIERIIIERAKLDALLAPLSDDELVGRAMENGWTPKDLMAHISYWERRAERMIGLAARGEPVPGGDAGDAAEGWVDRANARALADGRARTLAAVRAEYEQSAGDLVATLDRCNEALLFDPARSVAGSGAPLAVFIAGDTYEHYAEHGDALAAWLAM
jgi:hypothetical protein